MFWNFFTRFKNADNAGMEFGRYKDDSRSGYQSFFHDMRLDIRSNKIAGAGQFLVAQFNSFSPGSPHILNVMCANRANRYRRTMIRCVSKGDWSLSDFEE